ncbi:DUF2950 domain-containing protein, partial [Salmonella enterica]|uniref:DUF2950 domain-containing protein n=1 Tax=Salmonella enterica TaxID=28901 RepID=UPI002159D0FC
VNGDEIHDVQKNVPARRRVARCLSDCRDGFPGRVAVAIAMTAAGNEILTRTIGRNELSTLQAMHAYVDAQQDYYLQNHRWAH